MGLTIHRVLQWVASVGVVVIGTIITSAMGDWENLKDQAIRMEDLPQDVKEIKAAVQTTASAVQQHEWRITNLEKNTNNKRP